MAWAMAAMAGKQLADGYFASELIEDTAEVNEFISDMNAEFAELDAYDAKVEGEVQKRKYQRVIDRTQADQNALLAAKNIDPNFGTAAALQAESDFQAELNLMEIDKAAEERAMGFRQEARNIRIGGRLASMSASVQAGDVLRRSGTQAAKTFISGYYGS